MRLDLDKCRFEVELATEDEANARAVVEYLEQQVDEQRREWYSARDRRDRYAFAFVVALLTPPPIDAAPTGEIEGGSTSLQWPETTR